MAVKYLAGNRLYGTAAERTGMTTFPDGMGSAVNGYSTGVALETSVRSTSGFSTSALRWDGSDELILEPSGDEDTNVFESFTGGSSNNTEEYSIAFWFKWDSTSSEFRIISKEWGSHTAPYYDLTIRGNSSGLFEFAGNDDGSYSSAEIRSANLSTSTWYSFIWTQSATQQRAYINNVEITTSSFASPATKHANYSDTSWFIGAARNFSDKKSDGWVQDLCFWDKVISSDIRASLQTTKIANLSDTSGIKAYYPCDVAKTGNAVVNAATPSYPNFEVGTIFEESDTGKHYMWDGSSAWNEIA